MNHQAVEIDTAGDATQGAPYCPSKGATLQLITKLGLMQRWKIECALCGHIWWLHPRQWDEDTVAELTSDIAANGHVGHCTMHQSG